MWGGGMLSSKQRQQTHLTFFNSLEFFNFVFHNLNSNYNKTTLVTIFICPKTTFNMDS